MSRKALETYLDQRVNFWARFSKDTKVISYDEITEADAQSIFATLNGDLSPENLHCDGEISASQASAKRKAFMSAGKELQRMGFSDKNRFSEFA